MNNEQLIVIMSNYYLLIIQLLFINCYLLIVNYYL